MALIYSSMSDVEAMYVVADNEEMLVLDNLMIRSGRGWKCSSCDNMNLRSDPVCESCGHTLGPEDG